MPGVGDARPWLVTHGYVDEATAVEAIMAGWRERGVQTRRNWWDVLAGTFAGRPRCIEGHVFPVLAAARARKGWPPVEGAVERTPGEVAPPVRLQERWARRRRKRRQ